MPKVNYDNPDVEAFFNGTDIDALQLTFGVRHRVLRALLDLTAEEVAEAVGVDPYTVSRWERQGVTPQRGTRELLADFYGLFGIPTELLA